MKNLKSVLNQFILTSGKFSFNKAQSFILKNGVLSDIVKRTSYLQDKVKLSERCFNIINDITELPKCKICGSTSIQYSSRGYNSTCSKKCHTILKANNAALTMYKNGTYDSNSKIMKKLHAIPAWKKAHSLAIAKSLNTPNSIGILPKNIAAQSLKDTLYRNPNIIKDRSPKQRITMELNGNWIPIDKLDEAIKYRLAVHAVTMKQPLYLLENFNKRGPSTTEISDNHHIDHIFSVSDGFKNNISPEIIGHISNLRMLHHRLNVKKSGKSDILISELYKNYEEY